ncbi:hypothetical protein NC796_10880 [Aliifodinibius sp. S!AR15-10]|uniref:hypothetical protein n=1 Tax=Aliifodinibius sp. S!AR15-10 TaxID=2950437 RepID=UPI0028580A36|nr:hypothetical protein [Aliifodinibius sp. S!AR15-10]MDR8391648.1 hypothetical protein [Aliifodinibius sp. S!AR15-10]
MTGLPPYSTGMKSGQTFLLTIIPGIPISEEDLKFTTLSGKDLLGNPYAIDSAYRFSNLVNDVLISDSNFHGSGTQLDNLYTCLLQNLPPGVVSDDDFVDGISKITSATYNDDFLITITVPADGGESTWSNYKKKRNRYGVLVNSSGSSSSGIPVFVDYYFSASLKQLTLFRPWLNKKYLSSKEGNKIIYEQCTRDVNQSLAQITGLLLAKNLEVKRPVVSSEALTPNGGRQGVEMTETVNPEMRLSSEGPIIIGFLCKIL